MFFLGGGGDLGRERGGDCWREGDRKFLRDLILYCWEGCKVR